MSEILIVAGEASGDLLGAGLVNELIQLNPECRFFGLGGDKLSACGVKLIYHVKDLAFLGFWEAVKNLRFIRRVERDLLAEIDRRKPQMAILIDYPGFNLKIASQLRRRGIKIFYYVSPQIWAWGAKRIEKIKRDVDLIAVFFEFEKDIYERAAVPVVWVGHPLLDEIMVDKSESEFRSENKLEADDLIIGLFPGSRKLEVARILPEMLKALKLIKSQKPNARGFIGKASSLESDIFQKIIHDHDSDVNLYEGSTHNLMANARVNLVCSGTATLECAIIGTPFLILYKTSPLTYLIARSLIKIPHIGLANVVAGKKVAPELIQHKCTGHYIANLTLSLLNDESSYQNIKAQLQLIKPKLGQTGAAKRAAIVASELLLMKSEKAFKG